jgi:hypothetical protein
MTTLPVATTRSATAQHRIRRAGAVVAATLVNGVLWGVCSVFGVDFWLSDSGGAGAVTLPIALVATAVSGLLGWATLAGLERLTRRALGIWTGLAVGVTLLSIVPIFLEQATTGTRIALTVLHVAVAAALIPAFRSR